MKLLGAHRGRRRVAFSAAVTPAASGVFVGPIALADAPMTTGSIAVTVGPVTTANGTTVRTVTARGTWAFPTHNSDCNGDVAGAGYAVAWNDPHQPGNHVTTLASGSIDVGTRAAN